MEGRSVFEILTGKHTGKRFLGRSRRRWEDSINMDPKQKLSIQGIGLIWIRIGLVGESLRM